MKAGKLVRLAMKKTEVLNRTIIITSKNIIHAEKATPRTGEPESDSTMTDHSGMMISLPVPEMTGGFMKNPAHNAPAKSTISSIGPNPVLLKILISIMTLSSGQIQYLS